MVDLYRKKIVSMVVQMAKDDPLLVKELIQKLEMSGEIERDDLTYLRKIADKWIKIARVNRSKGPR